MRGGTRTWTTGAAVAVAGALIGGALLQPSHADEGKALHGAMPMDEQRSRLEQLQGQVDVTRPPAGMDNVIFALFIPQDNEMTPERVALGKQLYFDTRLSADNTVACATCHDVSRGFTDQRPVSEGIRDQLGRRNAPTTPNTFVLQSLFLDGRAPSLEEQAKLPPINPIEMGQPDGAAVVKAIADDPDYQQRFQQAYGRAPNYDDIGRAIANFERTLVFMRSPFDQFLAGRQDAISEQAQQGWVLFNGKARCMSCHQLNQSNPIGSDDRFHNIGVAARHQDFESLAGKALATLQKDDGLKAIDELALSTDMSELGRFMVTKNRSDIGGFRTSQLRNIGLTGPYMHDGSLVTLWDVMDHYNKGGEANPFLDGGIEPLALTEEEIDAVVALLFTMTDERFADQNRALFEEQRTRAATQRPIRDNALAMRQVLPFEQRATGKPQSGWAEGPDRDVK
jgi:cytochrome c peroxidase